MISEFMNKNVNKQVIKILNFLFYLIESDVSNEQIHMLDEGLNYSDYFLIIFLVMLSKHFYGRSLLHNYLPDIQISWT